MSARYLIPLLAILACLAAAGCSTLDWGAEIRDPRVDPGERRDPS
ncbi:MAG: hypothetical protein ACI8U3_001475 [Brevundimonas sp.]|jgi:hypothetical protein